MNSLSKSPDIVLYPASDYPLELKDHTADVSRGLEDHIRDQGMEGLIRFLLLVDTQQEVSVSINFNWLSIPEIERLAAGEELRAPIGEVEGAGRIRLLRGHENGILSKLLLEFIPDEAVPQGMSYRSWFRLRFPEHASLSSELDDEDWWVMLHWLWAEETDPAPTLAPDDELLWRAALNNQEHLLEAILEWQPKIEVRPGSEKSITQTALGIAMENTGMFGAGPGFMSGCHRRYRDDDFTQAEDAETWVPRAGRIAERLKAAGAIDYSPLLNACREGRTEDVEAMLKAGFPPNFSIYGHSTALCEAVQPGHEDVCDLLLCHGADPNLPRPFSTSMVFGGEIYPLSLATEHPAILKRLLQAGADPNLKRDDVDETPVLFASGFDSRAHAEEIFELVEFASIRGKHGRSGVFYLDTANLEFCRNIISTELLGAYDELGMTPLLHAIHHHDFQKAIWLLDLGVDPLRKGLVWNEHTHDLPAPHFQRTTVSDLLDQTLEQTPIPEYTGNANILPTMLVSPIQLALLRGSLELVERLYDLGAPADSSAIALYPYRAAARAAKESITKRLESESDGGVRIFADTTYVWKPEQQEVAELAGRLATILLASPHKARNYPEMVGEIDLLAWADYEMPNPALIEPFRSGKTLGKAGWIYLLDEALSELRDATDVFAEALNRALPDAVNNIPETWTLTGPLMHAEKTLIDATLRITGKAIQPPNLVAEVFKRASGDFDGGTARAYRDAQTTGKVGAEDFIEALAENLQPGSTNDQGKLVQAVRIVTARLEKRCENLRKTI